MKLFRGWYGNSPDLNPIENLWDQIKNMQRKERVISTEENSQIARKVWKGITPEYLNNLYEAMPWHMQAVIDAERGHIKY